MTRVRIDVEMANKFRHNDSIGVYSKDTGLSKPQKFIDCVVYYDENGKIWLTSLDEIERIIGGNGE